MAICRRSKSPKFFCLHFISLHPPLSLPITEWGPRARLPKQGAPGGPPRPNLAARPDNLNRSSKGGGVPRPLGRRLFSSPIRTPLRGGRSVGRCSARTAGSRWGGAPPWSLSLWVYTSIWSALGWVARSTLALLDCSFSFSFLSFI